MKWLKAIAWIVGITVGVIVSIIVIFIGVLLVIPRATHCVEVINLSPTTIDSIALVGAGADEDLGQLTRLESIESCFHPTDGQLVIKYRDRQGSKEAIVEGYLTNGVNGESKVIFEADGTVTIQDSLSMRKAHEK